MRIYLFLILKIGHYCYQNGLFAYILNKHTIKTLLKIPTVNPVKLGILE